MESQQTEKLERSRWEAYFQMISKIAVGEQIDIEVVDEDLGVQPNIHGKPLLGMSYDPRDDLLEIECEGVDHMISSPRDIFVNSDGAALKALMVVQADNTRQVVTLRPGPILPP